MGLFGFGKKKAEEPVTEDPITFDDTETVNKVSCCFYHGAFYNDKLVAGTKTTINYDENLAIEDVQSLLSENNSDEVVSQYNDYTKKELSKIVGDNVSKFNIRRTNELEFKNRFDCDYKTKAEDKFDDGFSEFIIADEEFIGNLFADNNDSEDDVDSSDKKVIKIANNNESDNQGTDDENVDDNTSDDENVVDNEKIVDQVFAEFDNQTSEDNIDDDVKPSDDCSDVSDDNDDNDETSSDVSEQTDDNDDNIDNVSDDDSTTDNEAETDHSSDNMSIEDEIEECGVTCDAANDPEQVARNSSENNSVDDVIENHDFGIEPIDCDYNKIPLLNNMPENQTEKEEVTIMSNKFVDTNEKYKNLLERTDLCDDSKNVLDIIPDVVSLQNEKAKLYGRSWCKHGEISAFFNIERKWDRFQNIMEKSLNEGIDNVIYGDEDSTDTFIDTVLDLTAYSSMLLGYIKEKHPDEYNKFFSK